MHKTYPPTGQNEDYGRQYPRFAPCLHVLGHFACEPVVCHIKKTKKKQKKQNKKTKKKREKNIYIYYYKTSIFIYITV